MYTSLFLDADYSVKELDSILGYGKGHRQKGT